MIYERFPNWDIDVEKGTIYSLKYKKYIGSIDKKGYVKIKPINKYKHWLLHQYIWITVNGDIPEGYDVHHKDGNRQNNSIYNLELLTIKEHHELHGSNIYKETKKKMSESHKGKSSHMLGKHHSEETRNKISENKKGTISNKRKKVAQYTLDGELVKVWDSATECNKEHFNQGNVSLCCRNNYNNKNNAYKGFIWKYI